MLKKFLDKIFSRNKKDSKKCGGCCCNNFNGGQKSSKKCCGRDPVWDLFEERHESVQEDESTKKMRRLLEIISHHDEEVMRIFEKSVSSGVLAFDYDKDGRKLELGEEGFVLYDAVALLDDHGYLGFCDLESKAWDVLDSLKKAAWRYHISFPELSSEEEEEMPHKAFEIVKQYLPEGLVLASLETDGDVYGLIVEKREDVEELIALFGHDVRIL